MSREKQEPSKKDTKQEDKKEVAPESFTDKKRKEREVAEKQTRGGFE